MNTFKLSKNYLKLHVQTISRPFFSNMIYRFYSMIAILYLNIYLYIYISIYLYIRANRQKIVWQIIFVNYSSNIGIEHLRILLL